MRRPPSVILSDEMTDTPALAAWENQRVFVIGGSERAAKPARNEHLQATQKELS